MFRIILSFFLPLFLPLLIYRIGRTAYRVPKEKPYPVYTLAVSGLILMFLTLSVFALRDRAPADSIYVPPRYVDGRIVPGHMETRTDTSSPRK